MLASATTFSVNYQSRDAAAEQKSRDTQANLSPTTAPGFNRTTSEQKLREAQDILNANPASAEVPRFIAEKNIPVTFGKMPEGNEWAAGVYIREGKQENSIIINEDENLNAPLLASLLLHEARHGYHNKVGNLWESTSLAFSPSQEFAINRFIEADACAYSTYAIASAARSDIRAQKWAVSEKEESNHAPVSARFDAVSSAPAARTSDLSLGKTSTPDDTTLRTTYISHIFTASLKTVRDSTEYTASHLKNAKAKAERARTISCTSAIETAKDNKDINAHLQRMAHPTLSSPFSQDKLPDTEMITIKRIIDAESNDVKKTLAEYDAIYYAQRRCAPKAP